MTERLRTRLTYSNVVATIALFVALGGGAYALNKVKSKHIKKNAVKEKHIAPDAVGSSEVAASAVGAEEIGAGAVGADEIGAGAIGSGEIGAGAVGGEEIGSGAVGAGKIAPNAVGGAQIAPNAVSAGKQIGGVTALNATSRVLNAGQTVTLASNGTISVEGRCIDQGDPAIREAQLNIRTTQNGTTLIAVDPDNQGASATGMSDGGIFPSLMEPQVTTVNAAVPATPLATAGTNAAAGFYESTYYTAFAPNGRALHGFAAASANVGIDNRCVFVASGLE